VRSASGLDARKGNLFHGHKDNNSFF
jgi:hypothetical protein